MRYNHFYVLVQFDLKEVDSIGLFMNPLHHQMPFSMECIHRDSIQLAVYRPKGFPYYLWLSTESGYGLVNPDNLTEIELHSGQGILLPPDTPYSYYPQGSKPWITSFITFSSSMSDAIPQIMGTKDYLLAADNPHFSFTEQLHQLSEQYSDPEFIDQDNLSADAYHFLLMIRKYSDLGHPVHSQQYMTYIYPVLKMIREQYATELTVQQMADAVFVTPQYLSRMFNLYLNMSVHQYLKHYRLYQAMRLLSVRSDLKIKEVSNRCGFSDVSHFIRAFKEVNGFTPGSLQKGPSKHYDDLDKKDDVN